jgi:hypothetical protein
MHETDNWVNTATTMQFQESPPAGAIDTPGIVLVAAPDSAVAGDTALQIGIGVADQPTCLVATSVSPVDLESYLSERAPTRPALGFVDATPNRPHPALNEKVAVIENIPSAHDLLQLVTAIEDVCEAIAPDDQPLSIVIPAVDPLLSGAPTDRVVRVLSHIAESTDAAGKVVIGVNYTAGSQETLQALQQHSNAVLWAERSASGTISFDFEPSRS